MSKNKDKDKKRERQPVEACEGYTYKNIDGKTHQVKADCRITGKCHMRIVHKYIGDKAPRGGDMVITENNRWAVTRVQTDKDKKTSEVKLRRL